MVDIIQGVTQALLLSFSYLAFYRSVYQGRSSMVKLGLAAFVILYTYEFALSAVLAGQNHDTGFITDFAVIWLLLSLATSPKERFNPPHR